MGCMWQKLSLWQPDGSLAGLAEQAHELHLLSAALLSSLRMLVASLISLLAPLGQLSA